MCWYKHEKPDPEPTDDAPTNIANTANPANPAESAESTNSVEICAICYEVPEKFGLMAGCPHVFCLGKSLSPSICNFELTFDCRLHPWLAQNGSIDGRRLHWYTASKHQVVSTLQDEHTIRHSNRCMASYSGNEKGDRKGIP
jgi:hypothetical protein